MAPIDKILGESYFSCVKKISLYFGTLAIGINELCKADPSPSKINLCVGAYRDHAGKPVVLKSIKEAEIRIVGRNLDKE